MKKRSILPLGLLHTSSLVFVILLLTLSFAMLSVNGANAASRLPLSTIGGCPLFPATNVWNDDISHLPTAANSASYVNSIGAGGHLHPDFGAGLYQGEPIGFSYVVVPGTQPSVPVSFTYADESNPGPYPIPANAPIEGGSQSTGDRHVLVVDSGNCKLYEMYSSYPQKDGSWHAGSGAVWDLNSNALRPATWTSADAAGLPILPGLITYDDVASGVINHALRFTVNQTQDSFLWPARHAASDSNNPQLPPMGLRLRLKASVNISSFSRTNQIILTALKQYGMFVADSGSSWYISGTADDRWNNDDLHALSAIPGSDFEAVDESSLEVNVNSGQAAGSPSSTPTPSPTATPTRLSAVALTVAPLPHEADTSPRQSSLANVPSSSDSFQGKTLLLFLLVVVFSGLMTAITYRRRKQRTRSLH